MAYAAALSKPLPVVGSPHSGSQGSVLPPSRPSKYGGKAGLSVPTVSLPAVFVCMISGVHRSGVATGVATAPLVGATLKGALLAPVPRPHATRRSPTVPELTHRRAA